MKPLELLQASRFLGEEFILWLWHRGQVDGGVSGTDGDTSACFLEDSIVLNSEHGDVKQISLQKGNPSESREAYEALARGMRPSRTKLRILSGDLEWIFTLDSASMVLRSLKLPPTTAKDPKGLLQDRAFLIEEGYGHLDRRIGNFLAARQQDPGALQETLRGWIRAGLQGETMAAAEAEA